MQTRTLESHASRVRCKLERAGVPGWVVNLWGVGYKLRPTESQKRGSVSRGESAAQTHARMNRAC